MNLFPSISLRYLITGLLALFSFSAIGLGYFIGELEMAAIVREEEEMHLHQQMARNQQTLETLLKEENHGVVKLFVASFGADRQNSLTFLADGNGRITASTRMAMIDRPWREEVSGLDDKLIEEIGRTGGTAIRFSENGEELYAYSRVCDDDAILGASSSCGFLYRNLDIRFMLEQEKNAARRQAIFSGLGIAGAGLLVTILLNVLVTRRTVKMIAVTNRFGSGDKSARIGEKGGDELALLGLAMDRMFEAVEESESIVRESEERLSSAQAIAHIGNWEWDVVKGTLFWSDEVYRIFGYLPGEVEATYDAFLEKIHPEDKESVKKVIGESLSSGGAYSVEHRVVTPSGEIRHVHERGETLIDGKGRAVSMRGTVQDITERVAALEEMDLYRMMIEKSGDPVFLIDDDDGCRMVYVNEAAVTHYGASREEILNWRIPDWDPNFTYKDLPRHVEEVKQIRNLVIESVHRLKDGRQVPVEISLNHVIYRGKTCHFGYFKNISERKRVQQELIEAKEGAERANLAKSQFLSNMSHELRTPMNGILGFAQLLEFDKREPLSERQKEYVGHILSSGEHLLSLIDEVLDLSKVEAGQITVSLEPVELRAILGDCVKVVTPLAAKRSIDLRYDATLFDGLFVRADLTRIRQVILNLLSNGIKYNREGGQLSIECAQDNHTVKLSVSDTGRGLSAEDLKRLFRPFERFDAENSGIEGTGIGLTITKKLVELMEGSIEVESVKGEGSSFHVILKKETLSGLTAQPTKDRPAMPEGAPSGHSTVLYVEDNPANLRLMEETFGTLPGIRLETAPAPQLGLDMARSSPPDLILLDINLPGMDGFQVLEKLKKTPETAHIPVVAVSANAMPRDIERGLEAGFAEYVTKPIDIPRLLAIVRELLGK